MHQLIEQWKKCAGYQRFEFVASLIIVAVVSVIACFAIVRLLVTMVNLLILKMDFLEPVTFQTLFGMIFIVLIALEFNKSILQALFQEFSVITSKGVVLIAIMVVVRKIIVMDVKDTSLEILLGLSALLFSLGLLYYFISRERTGGTE